MDSEPVPPPLAPPLPFPEPEPEPEPQTELRSERTYQWWVTESNQRSLSFNGQVVPIHFKSKLR